jgi:hypothetical protein
VAPKKEGLLKYLKSTARRTIPPITAAATKSEMKNLIKTIPD